MGRVQFKETEMSSERLTNQRTIQALRGTLSNFSNHYLQKTLSPRDRKCKLKRENSDDYDSICSPVGLYSHPKLQNTLVFM